MLLQPVEPSHWLKPRQGEQRLGEQLHYLSACSDYAAYQAAVTAAAGAGQKVAILAAPESIGPRANLGRGGAEQGWQACLKSLLNLQANTLIKADEIVMIGAAELSDLSASAESLDANDANDLNQLRELTAAIDERLYALLVPLFAANFKVILVGGGHNNAYPLLHALSHSKKQAVGALNLDPHADFRATEGRHSGNGFQYAYQHGYLKHYHVHGLHPLKNNQASLAALHTAGFSYSSVHDLYLTATPSRLIEADVALAHSWNCPIGIEVDVDAIQGMPASAYNANGISTAHAFQWVHQLAELPTAEYLHLAEAAPSLHPAGFAAGEMVVGQVLSELMLAFLIAR